jgi:hypothetical protein
MLEKLLASVAYVAYVGAYMFILWAYIQYIEPTFGYSGFYWNPSSTKIVEGGSVVAIISYLLPKKFNRPSDILLHVQFLFPILPMCVLYGARSEPREFLYFTLLGFLVVMVVARIIRIKPVHFTSVNIILLQRVLLVIAWIIIGSIIAQGGLAYLNFDFSRVYEIRTSAAENLAGIYGYVSGLNAKVLLPFAFLLAVVYKDRVLAIVALSGSIMMFALTAHKGPLFYPLMAVGLYYVLGRKNIVAVLIFGCTGIVGLSLLSFYVGPPYDWFGSLMLRRTFLVPAHLNFLYYEFFVTNPFALWADSKITFGLIDPIYNIGVPQLIGWTYYDRVAMSANTGWIGSGYANAGVVGMLLYSIVIGLLFSALDGYSKYVDKRLLVAIMMAPLFTLFTSSDLPTSFLNHGIILTLMLFAIFPSISLAQGIRPRGQNLEVANS